MNLDEIEARANAATPGPWMPPTQRERGPGCDDHACVVDHEGCAVWPWHRREDMKFAYSARTDVPALVAEVRRLREVIHGMIGQCRFSCTSASHCRVCGTGYEALNEP